MPTCVSGDGCTSSAVASTTFPKRKIFCREHQEQLDVIRAEFDTKTKPKVTDTFCSVPDCPNRPIYGTKVCHDHSSDADEEVVDDE